MQPLIYQTRISPRSSASLAPREASKNFPTSWPRSEQAVDDSGLRVPTGHGDRVVAFVSALAAKPFAILSGMSGSGKTQLALRLGEWFGNGPHAAAVPAGLRAPGLDGPEALFGYEDALRPADDGKAAWFVPDTLRFMLTAAQEPDMPYLLLLDEMNLAHVERYFSDFLSGVESRDAILPNLSEGEDGEWRIASTLESRMSDSAQRARGWHRERR